MTSVTNTTTSARVDSALLMAPFQLNIWLGLFIFVTGNISSIGDFIVFSSRSFRARACSIYLIAESISTFVYFNFVLVTRIIQKGFRLPITNRYEAMCKVRQFLSEYTHAVAFTFFALATLDRLLSTHRSIGKGVLYVCSVISSLLFHSLPTMEQSCFLGLQGSSVHRFSLANTGGPSVLFL